MPSESRADEMGKVVAVHVPLCEPDDWLSFFAFNHQGSAAPTSKAKKGLHEEVVQEERDGLKRKANSELGRRWDEEGELEV